MTQHSWDILIPETWMFTLLRGDPNIEFLRDFLLHFDVTMDMQTTVKRRLESILREEL